METKEKKESKKTSGWLLLPIGIIAIPIIGLILAFLLGISPMLVLGFLIYKINDNRVQKHRMNLKLEYQLKKELLHEY